MTSGPLAPLPVRVRPRHGETASSYIRRLARANHLRPSYLRSLVCSPPHQGTIQAGQLAILSGRPARALEYTLAGLHRRPGTGPPQLAGARRTAPGKEPVIFPAIRRDADADATIPVRLLAARHRTSRRTVLQALTPPSSEEGSPHPPWPAPLLAPRRELIDTWLTDEPGLPGYQIWERLLDEHDAEISYQRINAYVTHRRARLDGKTSPRTTPACVRASMPASPSLTIKKARAGQSRWTGPIYLARDRHPAASIGPAAMLPSSNLSTGGTAA